MKPILITVFSHWQIAVPKSEGIQNDDVDWALLMFNDVKLMLNTDYEKTGSSRCSR